MDLGCIDMGCVEKTSKGASLESQNESSASKLGKMNKAKDTVRSSFSALNKLTSQISKPTHRNKTSSPINWFPRKKVEPYLKRKIKMLQQVDGMQSTLDETLGDSNPHYCRVLREKIAIREAAEKAVEARKAAMVEASWCRILQASRIESKEAEDHLSKAELAATAAVEAAKAVGVIMNEAQNQNKTETSAHNVSATFESPFEVDRQVAAAVKAAFVKLAKCPPMDEKDFKELLQKISENPDSSLQAETVSEKDSDVLEPEEANQWANLVELMLGRIQCLKEGELASIATIVATTGLNAALAQIGSKNQPHPESSMAARSRRASKNSFACVRTKGEMGEIGSKNQPHPESSMAARSRRASKNSFACVRTKGEMGDDEGELPSLDKFLVKHLTRLEREVLEAKTARKDGPSSEKFESSRCEVDDKTAIPDLGSILVRRPSKLEKLIEEAKTNSSSSSNKSLLETGERTCRTKWDIEEVPGLNKLLVKRMTRLEREVQEARNQRGKENSVNPNKIKKGEPECIEEGLDKVLVKHVSRLEKEKQEFGTQASVRPPKQPRQTIATESLEQVLVKKPSGLALAKKEKAMSSEDKDIGTVVHSVLRRQARDRELEAAWGGLSLGNSIRPHVSRLQLEKAAWIKAEEEEKKGKHVDPL